MFINPIQSFAVQQYEPDIGGRPSGSIDNVVPTYNWSCGKPLIDEDINKTVDDFIENKANMAEKFVASQIQNVFAIGDIAGLNTLIFGNPYCVWMDEEDTLSKDGIFTTNERTKIVDPMLKIFSAVYVTLLTLAILLSTLKMGLGSTNPQSRSDFWYDVRMWVISGLLMALYIPFTNIIFGMNTAVVQTIRGLLEANGVTTDGISIIATVNEDSGELANVMSLLFTFLAEWVLAVILNFIYIARKVVILVLLVIGPIGAYSLLFNKTRAFFGTWLKELFGNVALQSIHGVVLFAFAMISSLGAGTLMKLGLMMMFIPVSGMISRWMNIGDSSSRMGTMMSMAGLGGVMSTMMIASQAGNIIRGGNMMMSNSSTSQASSAENALISAGGGSDSVTTKISSMATGEHSSKWQAIKSGVGMAGAVIGGAAGLATMNPLGVVAGAKAGQAISGGVAQLSRNLVSGTANATKTGFTPFKYDGPMGQGIKGFAQDSTAKREFFGNMGESIGSMVFLGSVGRKLGHGLSGVSRGNLASGQQSWKAHAAAHPNSDVMHLQTNTGSAFMMKTNTGQWQQVGIKGAADNALRNGQVRVTPYKLGNPNGGSLQLQPNGSYRQEAGSANGESNASSSLVGLPGSTPHIMRTENSYLVGGGNSNGGINQTTINAALQGERIADTNFDSSNINPDAYVAHSILGSRIHTGSDHMADALHISRTAGWVASGVKSMKSERRREII
jgi:hypothetical protein